MTRHAQCMLTGLLYIGALGYGLSWAEGTNAEALADEIALTELSSAEALQSEPPSPPSAPVAPQPARVSVLDVASKLALLVLAVYGFAWGARRIQRSGFQLRLAETQMRSDRLRRCASLALREGAGLHVVEVDRRPLLIGVGRSGEVSLLMDLGAPCAANAETPAQTASPAAAPVLTPNTQWAGPTIGQDVDWEERRDLLIRTLRERPA